MTCEDCNELVDVLIGRFGQDGPTGDPEYDAELGICSLCNGSNVHSWPKRNPCPQCDGEMKREHGFEMLWD